MLRKPPPLPVQRPSSLSNPCPYPGLTISKECVSKVEAAYNTRKGVISRPRLDAALYRCYLHIVGAGLLRQLCIGLLQLESQRILEVLFLSGQYPAGIAIRAPASQFTRGSMATEQI